MAAGFVISLLPVVISLSVLESSVLRLWFLIEGHNPSLKNRLWDIPTEIFPFPKSVAIKPVICAGAVFFCFSIYSNVLHPENQSR
jgi:hypothetical protein